MERTADATPHIKRHEALKTYREQRGWDALAAKCLRFVFGDQWESYEKRELDSKGRAPSVLNLILPAVDLIVGHFITNRADLVAKPVDSISDPYLAQLITGTMKFIDQNNDVSDEERAQFFDGITTGIGVIEVWNEYQNEPEGFPRVCQQPCWEYCLDKNFTRYDYSDARDLTRSRWIDHDEIPRLFGKKVARLIGDPYSTDNGASWSYATEDPASFAGVAQNNGYSPYISGVTTDLYNIGFDPDRKRVRVIEHYEKVWEEVEFTIHPETGEVIRLDILTPTEQSAMKDQVFTRHMSFIRLTTVIGNIVAQEKDLDATEFYHRFNFYFPYFLNGKYWGVVENLVYPQEETNKQHSIRMDILTGRGMGNMIYQRGMFDNKTPQEVAEILAGNNGAIEADRMYDEQGRPLWIDLRPPQIPAELFAGERQSIEMVQYISGATNPMQGVAERKTSGAAKRVDVEQGSVRLAPLLANFRRTQKLKGRAYLHLIQKTMTQERVFRIYGGPGESDQEIVLNRRAMGTIFNDVSVGRYDVIFEFEGATGSQRERAFWQLIEMANTVPQYAPVIAKQVIKKMPLTEKDAVIAEMQAIDQQQQALAMGGGAPGAQQGPRPSAAPRREPQRVMQ
jgi:hypothetical protein